MLPQFRVFEYDVLKLWGSHKCSKLMQEPFDELLTQPDLMLGNLIRVTRRGYRPICRSDLKVVLRFVRAGLGNEVCHDTDRLVTFFLMSSNFVSWERHVRPSKELPTYGMARALWDMPAAEGFDHIIRKR